MLRYDYEITQLPPVPHGFRVTAKTEGRLLARINGATFLDADGILLVEFAIVLNKWLNDVRGGAPVDFFYASMDFEEKPIFALKYDQHEGAFLPTSVWSSARPTFITVDDAVRAAESYILRLESDLKARSAVQLNLILEESLGS